MIKEENCLLNVEQKKIVSREMEVFYNPVMKLNRDIAILLLKAYEKNDLKIADLMAGSGVRTIRFLQELPAKKIKKIWCNDISETAVKKIKQNLKLNKINKTDTKKIEITKEEAVKGLIERDGFHYIDIDPFGTPNFYLDPSIKRLSREGILAVTATDTSALAGTYPKACIRKYWAVPLRNYFMHETALRILIRKVQMVGAQYEKPLIPIFSYSDNHYVRIYFKAERGREKTDQIIKQHKFIYWNPKTFEIKIEEKNQAQEINPSFEKAGPIWTGQLYDEKLCKKMLKLSEKAENKHSQKLLESINAEMKIKTIGHYDIHRLCKKLKIPALSMEKIFQIIKKAGHEASRTHTNKTGIKTDMSITEISEKLLQEENLP